MYKTKPNLKNQKIYKPLNILKIFMKTYGVKMTTYAQTHKRVSEFRAASVNRT